MISPGEPKREEKPDSEHEAPKNIEERHISENLDQSFASSSDYHENESFDHREHINNHSESTEEPFHHGNKNFENEDIIDKHSESPMNSKEDVNEPVLHKYEYSDLENIIDDHLDKLEKALLLHLQICIKMYQLNNMKKWIRNQKHQ